MPPAEWTPRLRQFPSALGSGRERPFRRLTPLFCDPCRAADKSAPARYRKTLPRRQANAMPGTANPSYDRDPRDQIQNWKARAAGRPHCIDFPRDFGAAGAAAGPGRVGAPRAERRVTPLWRGRSRVGPSARMRRPGAVARTLAGHAAHRHHVFFLPARLLRHGDIGGVLARRQIRIIELWRACVARCDRP